MEPSSFADIGLYAYAQQSANTGSTSLEFTPHYVRCWPNLIIFIKRLIPTMSGMPLRGAARRDIFCSYCKRVILLRRREFQNNMSAQIERFLANLSANDLAPRRAWCEHALFLSVLIMTIFSCRAASRSKICLVPGELLLRIL